MNPPPALPALGQRIRSERKRLKIAAQSAAAAAGISRVTLHRIEHGEPTVAIGLYVRALEALGLQLKIHGTSTDSDEPSTETRAPLDAMIALAAYPQLRQLAWQINGVDHIPARDALALYERNWRHVDPARMPPEEKALLQALVTEYGKGVMLV